MNKIIETLKAHPEKSINQIALRLRLSSIEVALAQREYYRPFIKTDSPKWGKEGGSVIK